MVAAEAVIEVGGIGKRYRQAGRGWVAVLQEVDLRLEAGAVLGLLGPNGAGKTTLIKILAGLLRPDTGRGTVLGYDLLRQHDAVRAQVSLVAPTADVGIDNNLTVRQNLAFWAPIYGLHGARARGSTICCRGWAWPTKVTPGRCTSARASGSASRSPARCSPKRRCSFWTSRPTSSTWRGCARCAS